MVALRTAERLTPLVGEPAALGRRPWLRRAVFACLMAVAVVAGHAAQFAGTVPVLSPVPAVAVLWLAGSPGRRARALDACLLVAVTSLVMLVTGAPPAGVPLLAAAITAHGLASAWAYRALRPAGLELHAPRDLLVLAVGTAVGAAVSVPVALLAFAGVPDRLSPVSGAQWLLHGAVSAFIVLAAALRIGGGPAGEHRHASALERCGIVLSSALTYALAFWVVPGFAIISCLLPVAVWAALRESLRAVTVHLVVVCAAVVVAVRAGYDPWAALPAPLQVVAAEVYLGVMALITLVLALYRAESERSARRVREQADLLAAVFASTSDAVTVLDARGDAVLRNPAAAALFGDVGIPGMAAPESGYGFFRPDGTRVEREDLPVVRALGGVPVDGVEGRLVTPAHPAGRLVSVSARPLAVAPGASWSGGAVAALRDVTEVRAATDEVARAHDLFASVLDAATEHAIVACDPHGAITVFNEGAERVLGWTEPEVLGRGVLELYDSASLQQVADQLRMRGPADFFTGDLGGRPVTFRARYRRRDGSLVPVSVTCAAMTDDGRVTGYTTLATDITAQLAAEQRLEESEALFRAAFDRNPVGIVLAGIEDGGPGRVLRTNRSVRRFSGHPQESLLGLSLTDLVEPAGGGRFRDALAAVVSGAVPETTLDAAFTHAEGGAVVGEVTATLLRPRDGEPLLLCLLEDVTERRAGEERLVHQALHDALTGLPNRTLLQDRLEGAITSAARVGGGLGVLYLDLDGFKAVNDTAGHEAGDALLRRVAHLLLTCVRPGDTVARLGGDEFAVVCPGPVREADLVAVGERVLDRLRSPVRLQVTGATLDAVVGASIGVSTGDGTSAVPALLHEADAAMYAAKRAGGGRVHVHGRARGRAGEPVAAADVGRVDSR
ncbi:diguanylate cyclase domain-containing protein [Kineococcus esterisolvens]|uniref:diguanylate cyclase domain-containing protein n=1 Tax=unclassified Kineococcus TaxID=2621656 RepID=UPI003D7DB2F6